MMFGTTPIPQSLFDAAEQFVLGIKRTSTAGIREYLLATQDETLSAVSDIPTNKQIIANRVTRKTLDTLKEAGTITAVKRGFWVVF